MFRSISVLCGFAVGSAITVKALNSLDLHQNILKASVPNTKLENSELELVLVQVLFRHGAKTPSKIIPRIEETVWDKNELLYELAHTKLHYIVKDLKNRSLPVLNTSREGLLKGGCRKAQLTIVGQQQAFEVGKKLKKLYIDELKFIEGTFDPRTTWLRTTHFERTIDSLRCLVAGIFEEIKEPVVFWTLPFKEEFLVPNFGNCPALLQYVLYWNDHALPGYEQDFNKFFDMIGGPVPKMNFKDVLDDLGCRKEHNKPYPPEIHLSLDTIEKHSFQHFTDPILFPPSWTNKLIVPLYIGQLLGHLCDNMKGKVINTNPYKFYLYSTHATTIISLLCAVCYSVERWPTFASYTTLELFKNKKKEYFVRILQCGKVMKFKSCNQAIIPLSQFEKIVSPYFIKDKKTTCQTVFHPPDN